MDLTSRQVRGTYIWNREEEDTPRVRPPPTMRQFPSAKEQGGISVKAAKNVHATTVTLLHTAPYYSLS